MRDGLRKLRHVGTHRAAPSPSPPSSSLSLSLSLSPFLSHLPLSRRILSVSFSPRVPRSLFRTGYGGHRSPVATGGTSGEPQEEYLLLVPPCRILLARRRNRANRTEIQRIAARADSFLVLLLASERAPTRNPRARERRLFVSFRVASLPAARNGQVDWDSAWLITSSSPRVWLESNSENVALLASPSVRANCTSVLPILHDRTQCVAQADLLAGARP